MKEPLAQSTVAVRYGFNHKIKTECAYQNKAIPIFLGSTAALCVLSLLYLDVDWIKLAGRVPDMGSIFYRLAQFDFKYMDLIAAAICAGCRYWCSHGLPFCVPCRRRYGCF